MLLAHPSILEEGIKDMIPKQESKAGGRENDLSISFIYSFFSPYKWHFPCAGMTSRGHDYIRPALREGKLKNWLSNKFFLNKNWIASHRLSNLNPKKLGSYLHRPVSFILCPLHSIYMYSRQTNRYQLLCLHFCANLKAKTNLGFTKQIIHP